MTDYLQPEFYRFNEDSLKLVEHVVASGIQPRNLLDIGAGCGVIGIELARKLKTSEAHFLELQIEWSPVLDKNISLFLSSVQTQVFWGSLGSWVPEVSYDLIVSNPPYFLPGNGVLSPDPVRAKCRSFVTDGWRVLGEKARRALAPGGKAFFVTLPGNLEHIRREWAGLPFELSREGELLILKIPA